MAELYYKETFTGVASQTTNIVLAGEVDDAPVSADYTITVSANLGGLVSYSGAYTSADIVTGRSASYPAVTVASSVLSDAAATIDGTFRDKDAAGDVLAAPNTGTPHLQGMFKTLPWVYNTPVFAAGTTPIEAVTAVSFGALTATTFAEAIADGTWSYAGGTDGSNAAVNLFEQCLAAGKISGATLNDITGGGSAVFTSGDSVSVYVSYTLTKKRSYTADSNHSGAGTTVLITVGAVSVGATPVEETADTITKVVRWKFVQSAV